MRGAAAFSTADGRTLAYRRVGAGPLLVCHPGGPGYSAGYLGDLGGLSRDRTLVLLDPRGTGGSDPPADPAAYETGDYVADLEELRLHLGEERLDLLGHSHGGVVVLAYAIAHPEATGRVVCACSLARHREDAIDEQVLRRSGEPWYAESRAALEGRSELAPEQRRERVFRLYVARYDDATRRYIEDVVLANPPNPVAGRPFQSAMQSWDFRPALPGVGAPTLVLAGDQDPVCGPACADDLASAIPDAVRLVLPDCGHFPWVEQPERWRVEVERFLR